MGKLRQVMLSAAIAVVIAVSSSSTAEAAAESPESIRIGLNYKTTALAGFSVNTDKGLQIGYNNRLNQFIPFYEEAGSNEVTLRKDGYFAVTNGSYAEYNPQNAAAVQGTAIGPIHIRIGDAYGDYAAASSQAVLLQQKGIRAYPVFNDTWQVWTGFYTGENEAKSEIANTLEKKLGSGAYTVVQPSATRIAVYKNSGDVLALFDSKDAYLQVHPKQENVPYAFRLNSSKKYRGDLEVRRLTGSDMTLINILPFEQYLYGVVPSELESGSHVEALKAQAVASRTFALNNMDKHKDTAFNLCTTTHCHVYNGLGGEKTSSTKAVDDTKGQLVMYNNKPAQVFYSASSGGRTESSSNVWSADLPYLKSVEDKYELTTSPQYYWEKTLTAAQIKEILQKNGIDIGDIVGVNTTKYTESGRVMELVISGTKKQHVLTKEVTRSLFGLNSRMYSLVTGGTGAAVRKPNGTVENTPLAAVSIATGFGIKSTGTSGAVTVLGAQGTKAISLTTSNGGYTFKGKGYGHGVGMSQEGAKGMANAGFTYDQILKYYFQGTTVQ